MHIVSVNVAKPSYVEMHGKQILTGIYKQAVMTSVWLGKLKLAGDDQADKNVHGGPDQAAYCYPLKHYVYWEKAFSINSRAYGTFGENLTITDLDEDNVHIGDVLQIGEARVQVTKPRIPCFKLAHKIGDPKIVKAFLQSGFCGFYLRVLNEGKVKVNDEISIISRDPQAISVRTALILQKQDLSLLAQSPAKLLQKALAIDSLTQELKDDYAKRLAKIV